MSFDDFLETAEHCRSSAQLHDDSAEVGDVVKTLFIVSSTHPAYEEIKQQGLLYKSKQYIISKHKKFEVVETIPADVESIVNTVRRKKERQSKPNFVFNSNRMQFRRAV